MDTATLNNMDGSLKQMLNKKKPDTLEYMLYNSN